MAYDNQILLDITDLQRRVAALERTGQLTSIVVANRIVADAPTRAEGTKSVLVMMDTVSNTNIARLNYTSYVPSGSTTKVRDLRLTSYVPAGTVDKNIYVTMDIYDDALIAPNDRICFMQMQASYTAGVLSGINLSFSKHGASGLFIATIDDLTNGNGYITVKPRNVAPANTVADGSIYYDSVTNKHYGKTPSGWVAMY